MIDAVVTWVDGADKAHIKKRLHYLKLASTDAVDEEAALSTRFASHGEIDFCLRSILKFAPWLRKIYIITDNQTPSILKSFEGTSDANRFELVHHDAIFEADLPTFNSLSIESMLWRIPGLSEQFIYFNDDCFLLRPLKPDAFFRDGKIVLRGEWKTQTAHQFKTRCKRILGLKTLCRGHRLFQENSARRAGFQKKFIHLPHVPFPLLKQTFVDLSKREPSWLNSNAAYRFRHTAQFWPISLAYHLGVKSRDVVFDNQLKVLSVNPAHHTSRKIAARLKAASHDENTAFACVQSLEEGSPDVQNKLIDWLEERIG